MSEQHWAVSVDRNGETILTIASSHLSGRDLSAEDEQTIRDCAQHLLAFVGAPAGAPAPAASPDAADRLTDKHANRLNRKLDGVIAQLRHAYAQLMGGYVHSHSHFAEGLIAPQIRTLEVLQRELTRARSLHRDGPASQGELKA